MRRRRLFAAAAAGLASAACGVGGWRALRRHEAATTLLVDFPGLTFPMPQEADFEAFEAALLRGLAASLRLPYEELTCSSFLRRGVLHVICGPDARDGVASRAGGAGGDGGTAPAPPEAMSLSHASFIAPACPPSATLTRGTLPPGRPA